MIQPITLVTTGAFFVVLYFRYKSRPKNGPPRTKKQQFKTAKLLFAAIVAWLAIHYSLQHSIAQIDGNDQEPSFMERVVAFLSK